MIMIMILLLLLNFNAFISTTVTFFMATSGLQSEIKAEYEKQKREIRKRLSEQVPNKLVDDEETPEPQAEPKKPQPDIDKCLSTSISC